MRGQKIIGVDIGGTKIHIAAIQDGIVLAETKLPTIAQAPKEQVLADVVGGIEQLLDEQVIGIGIGVPGLVDEVPGVVYDVFNIPAWQEVHLKEYLEAHFQLPVYLTNDANTFVLGEKVYGKAKEYKNIVGITLGTGMGTGIIINGNLYSGTLSSAGEIGSIPYLDKTIEAYCSGAFFWSKYGAEGSELRARAEFGDPEALEAFQQYGHHLGKAINIILHMLSPEAIFLGGSVSESFHLFEEAMQQQVKAFPFKRVTDKLVIEPSSIDKVALLGAAALFQMRSAGAHKTQEALS